LATASRDDAVETVRQRADIVEVIGRYVKLKKTGSNYVGLCPFHAERTPSFTVSPAKGFFHCFGCKASGDVFSFLMKIEGRTFPEALEELANRYGVELPRRSPADRKRREHKAVLYEINEQALRLYRENLNDTRIGRRARDYLAGRGVSEEMTERFGLGFARPEWQDLVARLESRGVSVKDATMLGLAASGKRGAYDIFRDRLVFPITGLNGKVLGFGARAMGDSQDGPKYINSRQSPIYDKSDVLYGLHLARPSIQQESSVILVEGYFDVISLVGAGVSNVVATCGTALTERHARLIARFTRKVVTIFDSDAAGVSASYRSAQVLLGADIAPYMVLLPEGEDPDSLVRLRGGSALDDMIRNARPTIEVLAERYGAGAGDDVESRTDAIRKLVPLLAACSDELRLGNYASWVAEHFGVDENDLRRAVSNHKGSKHRDARVDEVRAAPGTTASAASAHSPEEETIIVLLLRFANLAAGIADSRIEENFTSRPLSELLKRVLEEGTGRSPGSLISEIEDPDLRSRIGGRVMSEDEFTAELAGDELDRCIRNLKKRHIKAELHRLTNRIGQAEKDGQREETEKLLKNKMRLDRELISLGERGQGRS